jgi:hypothetical protein
MNYNSIEIIVARYNEDLQWLKEYPFNQFEYIVYNKGINEHFEKTNVKKIIPLENIGVCDHTYLYHIIQNYDNLSNIIVFLPGSLSIEYKKAKAKELLERIIKNKGMKAIIIGDYVNNLKDHFHDFQLDDWKCSHHQNNMINNETKLIKSSIRPYGKWFEHFFGTIRVHCFWLCGIFSIDKRDILQHPITRYQQILEQMDSKNTEVSHYIERSYAALFYPLIHTKKLLRK